MPKDMSNALVVNGSQTKSGHPIAVFGPQVSYFAPQILSVLDIHAPDYSAMGASFPGTGLVELGRGKDYAWSATSAESDLIDMRVEKICNASGGAPEANGTSYEFKGKCVPMDHEEFDETVLPKASGTGAPAQLNHSIYKTSHGIVQGWTTVKGKPVASDPAIDVQPRHRLRRRVPRLRQPQRDPRREQLDGLGREDRLHLQLVLRRRQGHRLLLSGLDPVRNPAADPTLPTWGTGKTEWNGYLTKAQHPHEVNPKHGYFISWNNKPAKGFATDGEYAYSQTYRSVLLDQQLKKQLAAHPHALVRSDVVKAMETAASQDLDGVTLNDLILKYVGNRPSPPGEGDARAAEVVERHRLAPDQGQARGRAVRRPLGGRDLRRAGAEPDPRVLRPDLRRRWRGGVVSTGGATLPGYAKVPMQWVNTPNSGGAHLGSAYDGGFEGYLMSTFQQLLGQNRPTGSVPS